MSLCGSSSPPPAPDYTGMANQQAAANLDAAKLEGKINNPNVITPYGTQTVTYGSGQINQSAYDQAQQAYQKSLAEWQAAGGVPRVQIGMSRNQPVYRDTPKPSAPDIASYMSGDPNQATLTQTLSPEQQAIYNQSTANEQQLGLLASQGISAAQGIIGTPVNYGNVPAMPGDSTAIRNQVYDAMMSRPREDLGIKRDNLRSDLIAAGVRPGSQAYDAQANLLNRQETDAQMQALLAGGVEAQRNYGMDLQSRQQALSEEAAKRQMPLNEITALMSGSQVTNPFQAPNYAQNAQVAPAPLFQAGQATGQYNTDVYNAQQAQDSALMSGLFSLGGAAIGAGGMYAGGRR